MSKVLSLAAVGLAVVGFMLATPSQSQAQGHGYGSSGYGSYTPGYGGGHGGYTPSYGGYNPGYGGYNPGYGGYNPGYGRGYGGGYGRPAIVHPQYEHFTPGRGWHEHGHIHVPHRGHAHTRPY